MADCLTMWLKVKRSRAKTLHGVLAIMVAALGALYIKDNYPKASPVL
jgi:hypothetical protein